MIGTSLTSASKHQYLENFKKIMPYFLIHFNRYKSLQDNDTIFHLLNSYSCKPSFKSSPYALNFPAYATPYSHGKSLQAESERPDWLMTAYKYL